MKKDAGIRDYADLKGKRVAVPTGTTNLLVMRRYSEAQKLDLELVGVKDHAEGLLLLENGRASAFASDDVTLFSHRAIAKNPAELEIVGEPLQVEPFSCMVRKDDPQFKALVDGVIGSMMKSGEFEKRYERWFLQPVPPRGLTLGIPMSAPLRENLKALSDKPAT